jgi:hypothetical protein
MLILSRIEANMAKLDEQMQCLRTALSEVQGGMQMLIDAQADDDDDDETDDEATHSTTEDDGSDTDMSFVVEDHSSSSGSYDTEDDSF